MSEEKLTLVFDGPAVENGEIDVQDLAPALLAIGAPSQTLIAKLGCDWRGIGSNGAEVKTDEIQKNTRLIAFNKAPTVFTQEEAKQLFGLEPSEEEHSQSLFLNSSNIACGTIIDAAKANEKAWLSGEALEQRIYEGFPSKEDERLALSFHDAQLQYRARIARQFGEMKYRQLALRLLYLEQKEVLTADETAGIQGMIRKRFSPDPDKEHAWRSLDDALKELAEPRAMELGNAEQLNEIKNWLTAQILPA